MTQMQSRPHSSADSPGNYSPAWCTKWRNWRNFPAHAATVKKDPSAILTIDDNIKEYRRELQTLLDVQTELQKSHIDNSDFARHIGDLERDLKTANGTIRILQKLTTGTPTLCIIKLKLKHCFTTAPILTHFDPQRECIVETDASDFALGGTLSQVSDDKKLHPNAFHSRKFSPAEINYEIHDKELLAIVDCFKAWRRYLEGSLHTVQVFTDHKNLEYFMTTKVLNRRQARWAQELAGVDFKIFYRKGTSNGKPVTDRQDHAPRSSHRHSRTVDLRHNCSYGICYLQDVGRLHCCFICYESFHLSHLLSVCLVL
jgi:hypothetical protein